MVAPNKTRRVVCTIVRVADEPQIDSNRYIRKPSTLVPWADPYIAGLVRRLQSEVRMERAEAADRGEAVRMEMFDNRGAVAWLAAARVAGLAAAVPYYGGAIPALVHERPRCPTMLHFGESDGSIPQTSSLHTAPFGKTRAACPRISR